ncbi:MAG: hypothetical protein ACI36V_01675 [Coriobacteriales bacterium]
MRFTATAGDALRWTATLAASAALALGATALLAPQAHAATGIPIENAADFSEKVNNNPSGSYYLAGDIDFGGSSLEVTTPFTGTLDGKGHTIKNYHMTNGVLTTKTSVLFSQAKGATFKNIKLDGYKAEITNRMRGNLKIAGLVRTATKCTFSNVTVSGSIKVDSPNRDEYAGDLIGGIAAEASSCTFNTCTNKVGITVSATNSEGYAGGIAAGGTGSKFTNCKNSAAIKVKGCGTENLWLVCGVTASSTATLKSCSNSAAISYVASAAPRWSPSGSLGAAGVAYSADSLISCSNSGAISVDTSALKGKGKVPEDYIGAAGVAMKAYGASKCSNTGAVSYTGVGGNKNSQLNACVGGVIGHKGNYTVKPVALTESFNTGKVTVKLSEGKMRVGGVAGDLLMAASNCYNTGAVSLNKGECVGGVIGYLDNDGKKVSACYNTGKVTGGGDSKAYAAAIVGKYDPSRSGAVSSVYYTGSGKGIGAVPGAKASAKKVSAITFGNCSGLSSKYWKNSAKKKRLVLKWEK